jgi:inner membrane protein
LASVFGHGLAAFTISKIVKYNSGKTLLFLAIASAIIPDLDVIAFKFGIPYLHPLGHRGFTHSVVFAIIWASVLTYIFGKLQKRVYFIVLFLSTLSHGILDAMTTGGKGIGFFIPFDSSRYFFPWQVIRVSPLGIKKFFSERGMQVIMSELKYIAIPCVIILITLYFLKKENYEH